MAWLKLTGAGSGKITAYNMDNILRIRQHADFAELEYGEKKGFAVTETAEEIFNMLNGAKQAAEIQKDIEIGRNYIRSGD